MGMLSILGLLVSVGAVLLGNVLEGSSLGTLLQPTALLVVVGGTLGAVLLQSSPAALSLAFTRLGWLWQVPGPTAQEQLATVLHYARLTHKQGRLALDGVADSLTDPLLRKGAQMVVDGVDAELLRSTLRLELEVRDWQHQSAAKVWDSAAGYAPTVGIMGSLLGLLHIMQSLNDASSLGQGIAVCFVATLYGVGLANLLFLPIAHKLRAVAGELLLRDEMWVEGLVMMTQGVHPRLVEGKLQAFLPQAEGRRMPA